MSRFCMRAIAFVVVFAMALSAAASMPMDVFAANSDFVIEDGVLTEYKGSGGDVVIPDGVTCIGGEAFYGCTNLKSVTIPNSVEDIDYYAFYECTNLQSVKMSNSVTSIGQGAFIRCISLKSISLPESLTYLDSYAFSGCSGLTTIKIPKSLTEIGGPAFVECTSLTQFTVDSGNKTYCAKDGILYTKDMKILMSCPSKKSGTVAVPDSVTEVYAAAFSYCKELTSISLPNSITEIGDYAFCGCTRLVSLNIPKSVTVIYTETFTGCSSLTTIIIPNSVTTLVESAFSEFTGLKKFLIPNSVTEIGNYCFWNCSSLESITIPNSVTEIGWNVFSECEELKDIYYTGSKKQWKKMLTDEDGDTIDLGLNDNVTIHYESADPDCNYFVLGRDNNNFNHTEDFFCDGDEKRGYIISDEYFNILLNKVSPFQNNNLKLARKKEWGGSCFGLSASMVLANRGFIGDVLGNDNYFDIDGSRNITTTKGLNLVHTINYYQLANNAFIIKKDQWHDEQLSPVGSRASFLKSLVEEAKKCSLTQTPFLFMYTYNQKKGLSRKAVKFIEKKYKEITNKKYHFSGGHCVIVCGYSYDASNDKPHKIKIYDPNSRSTYRYMYIGKNFYDFSYVDGNMGDLLDFLEVSGYSDWQKESLDLKDIVTELYYTKFDSLQNLESYRTPVTNTSRSSGSVSMRNMNQASGNNEKTSIMISLNSPFTLTLANGTIFNYDGIDFETSDKNAILDYQINADSNYAYLYLEVNSSDKLTISGDEIDVSAYINSEFYMAKVNNAENVVFDATNGLKINGESFDFDIAVDTNLKSTSLTEVTGSAHGNVTMNDNEDGVKCQFDGDHGNLSVNAYSDSDATTMMVENTGGFIICDDHNNHNTIIKTDNETVLQGDLNNDGIVNAKDNAILAAAFGKRKGNSGFNEAADFNNDGIINAKDKAIISQNFGKRK